MGLLAFLSACSEPNLDLVPILPEEVTYSGHIQKILNKSCVRCHGGAVKHGIDLSSYTLILESVGSDISEDLIVIGNPQSKILKQKLNPVSGGMYVYLSDSFEYDLIYKWIVNDGLRQ